MLKSALEGSKNPLNIFKVMKYKKQFRKEHPTYFDPEGLLVFTGPQGSGKTLSAVQYVKELCLMYPKAILCTNVQINDLCPLTKVIEYDGIESLTNIENRLRGRYIPYRRNTFRV